MKIKPSKVQDELRDIVQVDPFAEPKSLTKQLDAGLYWAKVAGSSVWELVVITHAGYVQELTGARRNLPIERVPGSVIGPLAIMPV